MLRDSSRHYEASVAGGESVRAVPIRACLPSRRVCHAHLLAHWCAWYTLRFHGLILRDQ